MSSTQVVARWSPALQPSAPPPAPVTTHPLGTVVVGEKGAPASTPGASSWVLLPQCKEWSESGRALAPGEEWVWSG